MRRADHRLTSSGTVAAGPSRVCPRDTLFSPVVCLRLCLCTHEKKKLWTNAGWSSNEKDIILRVKYDNMAPAMRADLVEVGRGRKKTSDAIRPIEDLRGNKPQNKNTAVATRK
ncbi:hypothetical protein QTP88_028663 [Uroleucon formosanum]